jgi:uncharacterized phosphosugar-binding protein
LDQLVARGIELLVWRSGNAPGEDDASNRFVDRFRRRVPSR